ncbi:MAG: B12-binding domain-containing protein [Elusimicrobia bacterium]|nr:B12-binding domain-containing protein [Elusimicrobiota bacterium]
MQFAGRGLLFTEAGRRWPCSASPRRAPATWTPSDAAVGLLQPALYRSGALWEEGKVSVADEHRFAAVKRRACRAFRCPCVPAWSAPAPSRRGPRPCLVRPASSAGWRPACRRPAACRAPRRRTIFFAPRVDRPGQRRRPACGPAGSPALGEFRTRGDVKPSMNADK